MSIFIKKSTLLNIINVIFVSILIGLVSSYVSVAFDFPMDPMSIKSLRLLFFLVSLICGIFALVNRSLVDEHLENILIEHKLKMDKEETLLPLSKHQALSLAVDNSDNIVASKRTIWCFVIMVIFLCLMIFTDNKDMKVSFQVQDRIQIDQLAKNTLQINKKLMVTELKITKIASKTSFNQSENNKNFQTSLNNISNIHLALKEIKDQQIRLQNILQKLMKLKDEPDININPYQGNDQKHKKKNN